LLHNEALGPTFYLPHPFAVFLCTVIRFLTIGARLNKVLTATNMEMAAFWDVAPYSVKVTDVSESFTASIIKALYLR
jgi:hypothetical protein